MAEVFFLVNSYAIPKPKPWTNANSAHKMQLPKAVTLQAKMQLSTIYTPSVSKYLSFALPKKQH
jgi:hypothetical protein